MDNRNYSTNSNNYNYQYSPTQGADYEDKSLTTDMDVMNAYNQEDKNSKIINKNVVLEEIDHLLSDTQKKPKSSNFQVYMNTVKLFFGNAYLSIPKTFQYSGIIGGILMFAIVGLINCYTMLLNLRVADRHPRIASYSQLSLKVFGRSGKWIVDISIWIMQLSCCISYLFFIGKQLSDIVSSQTDFQYDQKFYILLLTIPAVPICWIETYTFLSYFSIAGISVALVGMLCMFGYNFDKLANHDAVYTDLKYFDILGMFGHIGVAMFVFEGNAVIMNVRAEAKYKDKYPMVLNLAIVTSISLFMVFASVCYITYRDQTNDIFVLSLQISGFTIFIRLCTCFNALCSYPVQILAAFEIYEDNSWFKTGTQKIQKFKKIICRSIIVWLITGISLLIPNFTDFLNIAGSVGSTMIAFVLPPILYMKEFRRDLTVWHKIPQWAIVVFGVVGGTYSVYFSIDKIIKGQ